MKLWQVNDILKTELFFFMSYSWSPQLPLVSHMILMPQKCTWKVSSCFSLPWLGKIKVMVLYLFYIQGAEVQRVRLIFILFCWGFFLLFFGGRGVCFFKPGQFFNQLFILFSIFDAFTITMSPFHQQPSLAVTNLPKFSEEVNGRAGNWTLPICNDSQCTPLDRE